MNTGGDCIRVVHPLFREEGDGSTPISPLQLHFARMDKRLAWKLNENWHSRLPEISNWENCDCFGATFGNQYFAVAMWSIPSARALNGRGWWELRRMAIAPDAPKNTASRMLSVMTKIIRREMPQVVRLISYQDSDVHSGTIYKASGWTVGNVGERIDETKNYNNWKTRPGRKNQSTAPKVRWELSIRPESAPSAGSQRNGGSTSLRKSEPDLFAATASANG